MLPPEQIFGTIGAIATLSSLVHLLLFYEPEEPNGPPKYKVIVITLPSILYNRKAKTKPDKGRRGSRNPIRPMKKKQGKPIREQVKEKGPAKEPEPVSLLDKKMEVIDQDRNIFVAEL